MPRARPRTTYSAGTIGPGAAAAFAPSPVQAWQQHTSQFAPGAAAAAPAPAPASAPAPVAGPAPVLAPAGPPAPGNPFAQRAGDSADTIEGVGLARSGYEGATAQAALAKAELLRRYGVTEQADPATGRKYRLDIEGNPYSEAARIQRDFLQRRGGELTSAANGGSLFDGSYGQTMGETNYAEGAANEQLLSAVTQGVGDIEQRKQQAFQDAMSQILGFRGADADRAASTILPGQGTPRTTTAQTQAEQAFRHTQATAKTGAAAALAKAKAKAKARRKRGH